MFVTIDLHENILPRFTATACSNMAGTEPLNEEIVPHTEKPQEARGGGFDGLNKKIGHLMPPYKKLD